ncbi:uncharacterized protein [Ptychodera flava]|uniref:uncharacterized protein isoform X2 n=1 Tax=Ptychodera flava TaxID=63121 RepID=UPI00396A0AD6
MASPDARPCTPDNIVGVSADFASGNDGECDIVTPSCESSESVDVANISAALIVSTTVGWPITGGIPAALRLLISLLHSIGLTVYCTVYRITGHDQNFCRKVGLKLIKPKPPVDLRREQPAPSWLYKPEILYNDLLKLENIKLVFGLDMVTSSPAALIQREYFPSAAFCVINVFSHDTLDSDLDYDQGELELLRQLHFQLSKDCSAIFSIGSSLFQYFTLEYQAKESIIKFNHYRLLHYPDEDNFQQEVPSFLPSGEHFQIFTLVDENDIAHLTSDSILGKAMYAMAQNFSNMVTDPPKWKILGVRKGLEDEVILHLNPHPRQKIIFKPFPTADIDQELRTSHLVLVPPSSPNSVDLSLNAMAQCKPVIIPAGSPSHAPVKQYLREYEALIAVDMQESFENLTARIIDTIVNYRVCLKRAVEIRGKLKPVVAKVKGIMRQMIIDVIEQHTDSVCEEMEVSKETTVEENTTDQPSTGYSVDYSNTNPGPNPARRHDQPSTGSSVDYSNTNPGPNPAPRHDQHQGNLMHDGGHDKENHGHGQYFADASTPANSKESTETLPTTSDNPTNNDWGQDCMSIRLQVRDGVPEDDKHMDDVQRDLFRHERTHENSVAYMRRVMYIHPDLSGDDVREGSLIFRVKCGSSAATKALWTAYGSGRLDKMADDTFLTLSVMDDIGARCLSLETLIDYANYSRCVGYLKQKESSENMLMEKFVANREIDVITLKKEKGHLTSEQNTMKIQHGILRAQNQEKTSKQHILRHYFASENDREELEQLLGWKTSRLEKLKAMYTTLTGEIDELGVAMGRLQQGVPPRDTVRKLSRRGKEPGEVWYPWGLSVNPNDHVSVCDYGDSDSEEPGSVKTITADTAQIQTSVAVHGLPKPFRPRDTKMADNGDYYTADEGNECIVVSDAKSKVKKLITVDKMEIPTGVFVDKDRNVYITDCNADRLIKCNGDKDVITSQQLSGPYSVTMNSKNQLIVSCRGDENCICVLDSDLEILNKFGSDHLESPWGVAVDDADNIFVSDTGKIVRFDSQGEYQEIVTRDVAPYNIAVFNDGRIVCSDYNDNSVKVIYK